MSVVPLSYYFEEPAQAPLKVSLFTRIHEMRSTLTELDKIVQQPAAQKQAWVTEHEPYLHKILDSVTEEDMLRFEEPDMDPQMMKLLMEYTLVLQDLVSMIQSVFRTQSVAKSRRKIKV